MVKTLAAPNGNSRSGNGITLLFLAEAYVEVLSVVGISYDLMLCSVAPPDQFHLLDLSLFLHLECHIPHFAVDKLGHVSRL